MKKLLTISLLICCNMALGQQADPNAIFLGSKGKWKCPVEKGKFLPHGHNCIGDPSPGISFIGDSAYFVNAVFDGKVILVEKYDDVFMIMTNYGYYSIGYSNLSQSLVKKGDNIKAGQAIGNLGLSVDSIYALDIQLSSYVEDDIDILPWFKKPLR